MQLLDPPLRPMTDTLELYEYCLWMVHTQSAALFIELQAHHGYRLFSQSPPAQSSRVGSLHLDQSWLRWWMSDQDHISFSTRRDFVWDPLCWPHSCRWTPEILTEHSLGWQLQDWKHQICKDRVQVLADSEQVIQFILGKDKSDIYWKWVLD